jgi:hypothetical protein
MRGEAEFADIAAQLHPAVHAAETRRDAIIAVEVLQRLLGETRAKTIAEHELGMAGGVIPWKKWDAEMEIIRSLAHDAELAIERVLSTDATELYESARARANGARAALSEAVGLLSQPRDMGESLTSVSYYLSKAWATLLHAANTWELGAEHYEAYESYYDVGKQQAPGTDDEKTNGGDGDATF